MEENDLLNHLEKYIPELEGAEEKTKYKKNEAMAKRNLVDSIKDHLIPHVFGLKNAKAMHGAIVKLYANSNTNRKLALKNCLRNIKMIGSDLVDSYVVGIYSIKDELVSIRETIEDKELVSVALNGFPSSWEPFIQGVCARGQLPSLDDLWIDCVEEEARLLSRNDP